MIIGKPMAKPTPSAIWSEAERPLLLLLLPPQTMEPELLETPLPQAVPLPPVLPFWLPLPAGAVSTAPPPGQRQREISIL